MLKDKNILLGLALMLFALGCSTGGNNNYARKIIPFDKDWKFMEAEVEGAENPDFQDSSWKEVNVPHDWSIKGVYDENNQTGHGGGYLPSGIGWYRKSFSLDKKSAAKKFYIDFDGIMANSDVWINGHHLGHRPNGYVSFRYDLTPYLNFGETRSNVIAVRVNDSLQPASRYYTGAGIYRHVRLVAVNPVHISHWGVYITTPEVNKEKAVVNAEVNIVNDDSVKKQLKVVTNIINPKGEKVASASTELNLSAGNTDKKVQEIELAHPQLWELAQPQLYTAETEVYSNNKLIDKQVNTFGVRSAGFKAATGFWLNGKNIKIKGVCLHQNAGALGAAVPLTAWKRRLKLLKEAGVNAIRTAHNPPDPKFLDLCDQMGFLVMDEAFDTWNAAKNHAKYGYNLYFDDWWKKDLKSMILRDRNHPSIVIYSVGNEIRDNLNDSSGFRKYRNLQDLIHKLDPSRPVTMAIFRPGSSHVYTNGFAEMMDVVGQNYREDELVAAHEKHPDWKVIGTENKTFNRKAWLVLRDRPYMSGQFLWVGFDYLGEAEWPGISFGRASLFNRIGGWTYLGYQRQSWWSDKPVVHIVRHKNNYKGNKYGNGKWVADWTPLEQKEGEQQYVNVFSNCEDVELFLNGKSLGSQSKPEDASPRVWKVPFEAGTLKAVGENENKGAVSDSLTTAGTPDHIVLSTDQKKISKDWDAISYVDVKVVDSNGVVCPNADQLIQFSVNGPGKIIGVDNGNPTSHESYFATERKVYKGKGMVLLRATKEEGQIHLTASSEGIKKGEVEINIKK